MKFLRYATAAAVLISSFSAADANAGLIGSRVTGSAYDPDLSTRTVGPLGPVLVSAAVEFPDGTLPENGNLDITDTQIIYTAVNPATYATGSFDGFVLDFTGAPSILSVTQDAASGFDITYTFTGTEVRMNFSGAASKFAGEKTILDVSTARVPEPGTLALLGLGLAAAGFMRRRKVS